MIRDSVGRKIELDDIVLLARHTDYGIKLRHFKVTKIIERGVAWTINIEGINHSDIYAVSGVGAKCNDYCGKEQRLYILAKTKDEFELDGRLWSLCAPQYAYMGWDCNGAEAR